MRTSQSSNTYQSGFVSIFVVLMIMVVLALIATGFSTITRRAERRTLDNQLSTQAFYAAESGINDAIDRLGQTTVSKPKCQENGDPLDATLFNYTMDASLNVGYSCVIINTEVPKFEFSDVAASGFGEPIVVPFEPVGSFNGEFEVKWGNTDGSAAQVGSGGELLSAAGWGNRLGVLRIDLVPRTSLARADLITNAFTFYLFPRTTAGSTATVVSNGTANQGQISYIRCANNSTSCTAQVRLSPVVGALYTMRIQSLYNPSKVTVQHVEGISGSDTVLANGQAIVDVTGRANDVYRRIQVFVMLESLGTRSPYRPPYSIETADSICKRLLNLGTEVRVDPSIPASVAACNPFN